MFVGPLSLLVAVTMNGGTSQLAMCTCVSQGIILEGKLHGGCVRVDKLHPLDCMPVLQMHVCTKCMYVQNFDPGYMSLGSNSGPHTRYQLSRTVRVAYS